MARYANRRARGRSYRVRGGGQRPTRARSAALRSDSTAAWSTSGGRGAGGAGGGVGGGFSTPTLSGGYPPRSYEFFYFPPSAAPFRPPGVAAGRSPRSPP